MMEMECLEVPSLQSHSWMRWSFSPLVLCVFESNTQPSLVWVMCDVMADASPLIWACIGDLYELHYAVMSLEGSNLGLQFLFSFQVRKNPSLGLSLWVLVHVKDLSEAGRVVFVVFQPQVCSLPNHVNDALGCSETVGCGIKSMEPQLPVQLAMGLLVGLYGVKLSQVLTVVF
ncbi:unnamed protein product [Amaranthus hypochondriacus]